MSLNGKKAIVTGANRSIGQATAIALAQAGADVVITYRSDQAGAQKTVDAIESLGQKALSLHVDFSSLAAVEPFAEKAFAFLGQVDILINNAAMLARDSFLELAPATMQQLFQVNTIAPMRLSQLCAQKMIADELAGSIINISSISASMTFPHGVGYAATKAALNKWTQNAALDLAQHGIRVNAVAPGFVEAGMNQDTASTAPLKWKQFVEAIPLGRTGQPRDIASMVLFLLSHEAQWITGKVFEVDGGHVLS
tara:strand:- start:111 stop:869 length:759 start_codon:yes stop_codon:yes gene_type:complete